MTRRRVYVLDAKRISQLRYHGKLACFTCKQQWKEGEEVCSGAGGMHRNKWPRHTRCLMLDSRPRVEVALMVTARN